MMDYARIFAETGITEISLYLSTSSLWPSFGAKIVSHSHISIHIGSRVTGIEQLVMIPPPIPGTTFSTAYIVDI